MAKVEEVYGITEPRIYTPPAKELTKTTSLGYACIEYAENILKKKLYEWQKWALIHMFEIEGNLEEEWHFRFRTILLLVSRQNGKTMLSEVIASFFMNILKVKSILGTSLSVEKALESLSATIEDQKAIPELAKNIRKVCRSNGNNKMILNEGQTYKIAAAGRRAGRGDSHDLILLDELRESRNWELWSAAVASTSAKPNALVICFSNAGDPDSVILRQLRSQAISEIKNDKEGSQDFGGEEVEALGLFEWSAEDDASAEDIHALAQANPALGYGKLTMRALVANRSTFPENKFRSECMCQTVDTLLPSPFPRGTWSALEDNNSCIAENSDIYYGIDMSADRKYISIAACGLREDGNYHIELITKRSGISWVIDWFRERSVKGYMNLAFQGRGAPVSGIAEEICTLPGINRYSIEGQDLSDGWNRFYDGIIAIQSDEKDDKSDNSSVIKIYHMEQPILDRVAKTMQLKKLGNGIFLPDRMRSPDDIGPLFACIMAYTAATLQKQVESKKIYQSAYNGTYTLDFI